MRIILIFLLFYLDYVVGDGKYNEFITLFSPRSVFEKKNHNIFIVSKNIDKAVEVGIQFRKINFTVNVQNDGIMRVEFENDKSSGGKVSTNVTYTMLRNMTSNSKPQCSTQNTEVLYDKDSFYVFIQLDKPVYAPGHNIRFRVIVIDRDLKPFHMNNINITIEDPFGRLMHEIKNLGKAYSGIFSNNFTLSEYTQLGDWKINVVVDKKLSKRTSKVIPVQKYVLPLFSVTVIPTYKHLQENQKLELTFYAKYPYGDYVAGNAVLVITRSTDKVEFFRREYKNIFDTQNDSIHVTNDMKIGINDQTDFDVTVIFTEPQSGKSENKTAKVTIHKDIKYQFHVDHPTKFYCGLPFNVRVFPSNWKNEAIEEHYEHVEMIYIYKFANKSSVNHIYSFKIVNGVAMSTGVIVPENTVDLTVEIKFINSALHTIQVSEGDPYIKSKELVIDYSPKPFNQNEKINIHIASVIELDELIVVVMTRHGNIESKKESCGFQLNCKFSLQITEKMIPESTVIVYALTDINQFVYGEVKIKSNTLGANYLDIKLTAGNQSQKSHVTTKTKSKVTMDISTKSDSKVYLLAFDKRLTYLRQGNEVTRRDVIDGVSQFDKSLNIVFEDLKNWHDCSEEEIQRVVSGRKDISQQSSDFFAENNDDFDDDENENDNDGDGQIPEIEANTQDDLLRDNFPETWIFEEFDVKNENEKKIFKVPDSITSWLISAFSIHKKLGLAVADTSVVTVKNDFFIKMLTPYSIRFREILRLNILVYNYVESKKPLNVSVSLHNKDKLFQFVKYSKGYQKCDPTFNDDTISTIDNVIVPSSGVKKVSFYIRSHPSQDTIKGLYKMIVLIATAKGETDDETLIDRLGKNLRIEQFGVKKYDMIQESNRLTKSSKVKQWNPVEIKTNTTDSDFAKMYAFISSDYLSDVNILYNSWGFFEADCLSQRTGKFKACISYNRYRIAQGDFSGFSCKYDAWSMYQTLLSSRSRYGYDSSAVSLVTFIETILSAMEIGALSTDTNTINNELSKLSAYQNSDGSFTSDSDKYYKTAYCLYLFIKYRGYYTYNFENNIIRAFNYLNAPNNKISIQPKDHAIAAYAYALNANHDDALKHMNEVEKFISTEDLKVKKNCFKPHKTSTSCDMQHTAYAVLTYAAMGQNQKAIPFVVSLLKDFGLSSYFSNTQSYFITSEAISRVISTTRVTPVDFSITLQNEFDFKKTLSFNHQNSSVTAEIPLPDYSKMANITTKGSGYCTVVIVIEQIIRLPTIKSYFDIGITVQNSDVKYPQIRFCTKYTKQHDIQDTIQNVIMEVEVPSGYVFNDVVNKQNYASFLKDVIKRKKDTLAVIYLIDVKIQQQYCFAVQLTKVIDVVNPEAAGVKVYDFSNKDSVVIDFYNLDTSDCMK